MVHVSKVYAHYFYNNLLNEKIQMLTTLQISNMVHLHEDRMPFIKIPQKTLAGVDYRLDGPPQIQYERKQSRHF